MKRLIALIFCLSFLYASAGAYADAGPPVLETLAGCTKYEMCSAQTATGVCTVSPASGDERVIRSFSFSNITFYSLRSVGSPYECNIISNDRGHDAASGVGFQINATALTSGNPIISFSGLFDYLWITCPTITTSVTVTALVCTASR